MPVHAIMILCAAALVAWVYHYDRYEKEPWYAIALALLAGYGAMWVIGFIDDAALKSFSLGPNQHAAKAALVAVIEESGKLLTMLLIFVLLKSQFNDPMDGLIYGRLIGLGMAVEESLLYISLSPPTLQTCGAELVRLFAHSLMGALVGFAIGLGAHPHRRQRNYPLLAAACLGVSMLLHFGWDWVAYFPDVTVLRRLAPLVMMAGMLVMWQCLCAIAEARSRLIFAC